MLLRRKEAKQLFDEYIATAKQMLLTATELRSFNNSTTCHICTKPLGDHCHIAGRYRGISGNRVPLIILFSFDAKVSIPMTIWVAITELTRRNYLRYVHRMRSLASCLVVHIQTQNIQIQLGCGLPLGVRQWQITMTSTYSWMCCFQQTSCLEYYSLDPVHY